MIQKLINPMIPWDYARLYRTKIFKKNVDQSQAILVTLLEFGHEIGKTGFKEE